MTRLARLLAVTLALGMLTSLLGGLARLGISPLPLPSVLIGNHGVLMGGILLPGLIGLERAVAIGKGWPWAVPILAVAALFSLLIWGEAAYPGLILVGLGLTAQQLFLWLRRPGWDGPLTLLGIASLVRSDWDWGHGQAVALCAPGWASFLILIIAAERLEFSFLCGSRSLALPAVLGVLAIGLLGSQIHWIGAGWLLLSLWLTVHDMARRNARRSGLTAYTARSVLLGYAWLAVSGAQLAIWGLPYLSGPYFDRVMHGVFVGFVLSMVLAHGPIVFPSVCQTPVKFSHWFYLPLLVLHLSLLVRCLGWRPWGATGNLLALVLFGLTMASHHQPGHNPWLASRPPSSTPA